MCRETKGEVRRERKIQKLRAQQYWQTKRKRICNVSIANYARELRNANFILHDL